MYLKNWFIVNSDEVRLIYTNDIFDISFCIRKNDFDRAFGAIINADFESVKRDFFLHN